jgi:DNA-entry nuclease
MDKIPVGNQIQAKSNDGRVNLNVFIPNVQMGVIINYQTGDAKIAN